MTQTFLQIGWAVLDLYAWVSGANFARKNNQPMLMAYFVAAFLLGTFLGSILTIGYGDYLKETNSFVYATMTYLPLFIALFAVVLLPKQAEKQLLEVVEQEDSMDWLKVLFKNLTARENEVAYLLIEDITNEEAGEKLFIS